VAYDVCEGEAVYDALEGEAVAYDACEGEAVAYDTWEGEAVAYDAWEGEDVAYVWKGEWASVVGAGKEDTTIASFTCLSWRHCASMARADAFASRAAATTTGRT
jgi:hypothetical protein